MPAFYSMIVAHVDKAKRPEEMPETIKQEYVDEVQQPMEVLHLISGRLRQIVENGGMVTSPLPLEGRTTNNKMKRIWVPMHMLTYFESDVKIVSSQVVVSETGEQTERTTPQ